MDKVLILGGYGNFGKRIARLLTRHRINVIIAGRSHDKAQALARELPPSLTETTTFDIRQDFQGQLASLKPAIVINTCGPFQGSDYSVAEACIRNKVHYIDLADGRDYVTGITALDAEARNNDVAIIGGASTVPGLSSAVIEHYLPEFASIENLTFGIAPGQRAERGLATTQAILGYVGKKLKPCAGYPVRYGWQDLYRQSYPRIGNRWMANCDIPDLDLLPQHYSIQTIRFSAGMENPIVHLGIWLLSWAVRWGLVAGLDRYAPGLLKMSNGFNFLGSADGGMHMILQGIDSFGQRIEKQWFIIALEGDGPYIPVVPAVVLARKIWNGTFRKVGAYPCVGLVSLEEYLDELKPWNIKTYELSSRLNTE